MLPKSCAYWASFIYLHLAGVSQPCHVHTVCPEKGETKKSTTLPRKKIKEKLWEVWTRLILCSKWGKMPRELLLKILLRNIQPPKFTAIIWVQNSVLLFVRHILSKWHGVKFKNSALCFIMVLFFINVQISAVLQATFLVFINFTLKSIPGLPKCISWFFLNCVLFLNSFYKLILY